MNDNDKTKLAEMNTALNRWAARIVGGLQPKRIRRLSYAAALREAERCRRRMKIFGHY